MRKSKASPPLSKDQSIVPEVEPPAMTGFAPTVSKLRSAALSRPTGRSSAPVPDAATPVTLAFTTSLVSTSETDSVPEAVNPASSSVCEADSESVPTTSITGASFVPTMVTVMVSVVESPLLSVMVTLKVDVIVSPSPSWSAADALY